MRRFCCGRIFSAEGGIDLEPESATFLLEELESWAEVLTAEPEVIHRLAAFAAVAADLGDDCQNKAMNSLPSLPRGIEP